MGSAAGPAALGLQVYSASTTASAMQIGAREQQYTLERNAKTTELMGADAIERGREEESRVRLMGRRTIGAQRASLAAQGVDIGVGSAADITADTALEVELDALTVRNNAAREAWGYKVKAQDLRAEGHLTARAGKQAARNTLLIGAGEAAFYAYRKKGG